MTVLTIFFFIVLLLITLRNVRIVPQGYAFVIERLGTYSETWQTGLHIKMPFIDKVVRKISIKERMFDFEPVQVITKDNVTITVDSVIFFQVLDTKLYTYGADDPLAALNQLTNATLRNLFGAMDFDAALTGRDTINEKALEYLDKATDPWGIKINRVELKKLVPPKDVQDAMERQIKAERERREVTTRAEGQKQAAILTAEGDKDSRVLKAQADKEVMLLQAQAKAEAIKQVAEAEAEAIRIKRRAEADGLRFLSESNLSDKAISIRSYEAAEKMANGTATKLIIPSNLQGVATLASVFKESLSVASETQEIAKSNEEPKEEV